MSDYGRSKPADARSRRLINLLALAWGFAEATLFFIVPDVLLTWIALRSGPAAFRACVWALGGALMGGMVMHAWGTRDCDSARHVIEKVPAIDSSMFERVHAEIRSDGVIALLRGPLGGVPYKVFAVSAGALGVGLLPFVLISVPARMARFIIITGATMLLCRAFSRMPMAARCCVHISLWTAFYVWYFWRFGSA